VNVDGATPVALETQTRAVGVIQPPPDVRAIVDKTAQFVAKNGPEFEKRILGSEKNNAKFNFLLPADPYHAYYQSKIAAFKEEASGGDAAAIAAKAAEAAKAANDATGTVAVAGTGAAAPKILAAPRKAEFSVDFPAGIQSADLDVIKLTAQFAATNGVAFIDGLRARENANPRFNFLKPTHSMHPFFNALADAYAKVLKPPKDVQARLAKDEDKSGLLERALQRLEWERTQDAAKQKEEDEKEAEREAFAMIDWHDFVVVETIDFLDEEDDELPEPLTLRDVVAQFRKEEPDDGVTTAGDEPAGAPSEAAPASEAGASSPAAVAMDEDERAMIADGVAAGAAAPDAGPPVAAKREPAMKIVRNHKKPEVLAAEAKARAAKGGADATKFAVSPITGELVAVDDMAEHMRVSLIDPKWKTQKEAMMEKLKNSTMASDEEVAANVLTLARTRPDIFGTTDEEVTKAMVESIEAKKTAGPGPGPAAGADRTQPAGAQLRAGMAKAAAAAVPAPPPPPAPLMPAPPPAPLMPPPPPAPASGPSLKPAPAVPTPPPLAAPPAPPLAPAAPEAVAAPELADAAAPPEASPESKKRKIGETELDEEADFLAANPGGGVVRVSCPSVEGDDHLNGQTLEIAVDAFDAPLSEFKKLVKDELGGLAANKQKISAPGLGFLNDKKTFAYYNLGDGAELALALKERGGRKK
jgi:splicing factor 3A subunit 1